jgi:hypothetical protein
MARFRSTGSPPEQEGAVGGSQPSESVGTEALSLTAGTIDWSELAEETGDKIIQPVIPQLLLRPPTLNLGTNVDLRSQLAKRKRRSDAPIEGEASQQSFYKTGEYCCSENPTIQRRYIEEALKPMVNQFQQMALALQELDRSVKTYMGKVDQTLDTLKKDYSSLAASTTSLTKRINELKNAEIEKTSVTSGLIPRVCPYHSNRNPSLWRSGGHVCC